MTITKTGNVTFSNHLRCLIIMCVESALCQGMSDFICLIKPGSNKVSSYALAEATSYHLPGPDPSLIWPRASCHLSGVDTGTVTTDTFTLSLLGRHSRSRLVFCTSDGSVMTCLRHIWAVTSVWSALSGWNTKVWFRYYLVRWMAQPEAMAHWVTFSGHKYMWQRVKDWAVSQPWKHRCWNTLW